jgi:hypothetical protein
VDVRIGIMITDDDVTKLKKTFATKDEFNELSDVVTELKYEVGDLRLEVAEIRDKMDAGFAEMRIGFDKITGAIHDLRLEMSAGYSILERKIYYVAEKTGVIIPD